MDAIEEFIATCPLAFTLATVVAVFTFLQKTGGDLQAMKLGEKCLIFLGSNARIKEDQFTLFYQAINELMFEAACRVPDYKSAERYAKELLIMHHASNDTVSQVE